MLPSHDRLRSLGRAARGSVIAAVLAAAALSCAALIGIDDRLPDDVADGAAPDVSAPDGAVDGGAEDAGAALTYGVGDGHRGPLTVTSGQSVYVNSYAALVQPAQATDRLSFDLLRGEQFAVGDLVLVWQTATSLPLSGATTLDLSDTNVGQWEIARVTAVNVVSEASPAGELTLDHAVGRVRGFTVPGAQVVRVPEHTDVTIQTNASISAQWWDGASGGVVALYVSGTLRNDGSVYADGSGFRGGLAFLTNNGALVDCTAADGLPDAGFARKGEGVALTTFGDAGGLGNLTNGGGGGNCYNAGGGGGGNGGRGGHGGFSGDNKRDVGGRGGAALLYPNLLERLTLGGGGGAGEADNGREVSGGRGGGVVIVRATEMVGAGRILARGTTPQRGDQSGAGGGGAGGSAIVQVVGTLACGGLSVRGGSGANLESGNAENGPGGGGGGGRALVQGKVTPCSIENRAGAGGRWENGNVQNGSAPEAGAELTPPYTIDPQIVSEPYCGTCP